MATLQSCGGGADGPDVPFTLCKADDLMLLAQHVRTVLLSEPATPAYSAPMMVQSAGGFPVCAAVYVAHNRAVGHMVSGRNSSLAMSMGSCWTCWSWLSCWTWSNTSARAARPCVF